MIELWVTKTLEVLEVLGGEHHTNPFSFGRSADGQRKFFYRLDPSILCWVEMALGRAAEKISKNLSPDDWKSYQESRAVATDLRAYVVSMYGLDVVREAEVRALAEPVRLPEPCDIGVPLD